MPLIATRSFIRHPTDIPIDVVSAEPGVNDITKLRNVGLGGLCYRSESSREIGTYVKIRIPAIKPLFELPARVAWCQANDDAFEIGVQFMAEDDAYKARMIEQLCHIEHYRSQVLAQEGRTLSGQEAAAEWIEKFAADFPNPTSNTG